MSAPPNDAGTHGTPARVLFIIRAAIVSGVLLFAVVAWVIRSSTPAEVSQDYRRLLGMVALVVAIAMAGALYVVRGARDRAATRAQKVTQSIVAWALGEAAAMLGVVYFFVTGALDRAWPGLVVLLLAVALFPVPPDEG